jgi:acyl-CoA synthetase (AMP-forming)/AMP-acid ligase II
MNFCEPVFAHARQQPQQLALQLPQMRGRRQHALQQIRYGDLLTRVGALQTGLLQQGYVRGDRVIIVLRPCIELYALTLALLGLGMVPVFIDAGMPRALIQAAIQASGARALISHRRILWLTCWWSSLRPLDRFCLEGSGPGFRPLKQLQRIAGPVRCADMGADDFGLITFTSGSTGKPKGANRTHGSLIAQHQAIRHHWPDEPGDIDMPCFPVLVLHNLCCGMTTAMPPLDLARPAQGDGRAALEAIRDMRVTRLSGAPAWMENVARAALKAPKKTRFLRDIVIGGAAVSETRQELFRRAFPFARIRIVYGSTEAEPVSDIELDQALAAAEQDGYLVGPPAPGCELALVDPTLSLDDEQSVEAARVEPGQCGEILVRGAHVLKGYVDNPEADRENKIACADGLVWHRTGDTGWLDAQGRLWLAGRVKDRIHTNAGSFDVFPFEITIERRPEVNRTALVQLDNAVAVFLVLEQKLTPQLLSALQQVMKIMQIDMLQLHITRALPMDRRHNSKIDRPALRQRLARGQQPHRTLSVETTCPGII